MSAEIVLTTIDGNFISVPRALITPSRYLTTLFEDPMEIEAEIPLSTEAVYFVIDYLLYAADPYRHNIKILLDFVQKHGPEETFQLLYGYFGIDQFNPAFADEVDAVAYQTSKTLFFNQQFPDLPLEQLATLYGQYPKTVSALFGLDPLVFPFYWRFRQGRNRLVSEAGEVDFYYWINNQGQVESEYDTIFTQEPALELGISRDYLYVLTREGHVYRTELGDEDFHFIRLNLPALTNLVVDRYDGKLYGITKDDKIYYNGRVIAFPFTPVQLSPITSKREKTVLALDGIQYNITDEIYSRSTFKPNQLLLFPHDTLDSQLAPDTVVAHLVAEGARSYSLQANGVVTDDETHQVVATHVIWFQDYFSSRRRRPVLLLENGTIQEL